MEKDYEVFYVKAPLEEHAKLASQLISCQIPFEFDGSIRLKIEVWPMYEKSVLLKLAGMRRRCERNKLLFEMEHYPVKL